MTRQEWWLLAFAVGVLVLGMVPLEWIVRVLALIFPGIDVALWVAAIVRVLT